MKSKQRANKENRHTRSAVLLVCLVVFAIVGFSIVSFSMADKAPLNPTQVTIAPASDRSYLNQVCQQKLLDHIKKGDVDLHAEMSYGNLQGCSFRSESERRNQAAFDNDMSIITRNSIL